MALVSPPASMARFQFYNYFMPEILEKEPLFIARDKEEIDHPADGFDELELLDILYAGAEKIDEQAIRHFRDSVVKPEWRSTFDSATEQERLTLVATHNLPAEELEKLKAAIIEDDLFIPSIHNVRNVFSQLYLFTGDERFYLNGMAKNSQAS